MRMIRAVGVLFELWKKENPPFDKGGQRQPDVKQRQ